MVLGITGNFGSGKTTVANMFKFLGGRVIDADKVAHEVIKPRTLAYKQILAHFGKRVLVDNRISRGRLAEIAFSDKKNLRILNQITHPQILKIIRDKIDRLSDSEIVVIDAALLIESGLLPCIDKLVVVRVKPEVQIERLKKRGVQAEEAKRRLSFQLPQQKKINYADFVIDNSGRKSQTEKQVREIWYRISKDITYGA